MKFSGPVCPIVIVCLLQWIKKKYKSRTIMNAVKMFETINKSIIQNIGKTWMKSEKKNEIIANEKGNVKWGSIFLGRDVVQSSSWLWKRQQSHFQKMESSKSGWSIRWCGSCWEMKEWKMNNISWSCQVLGA